MGGLSPNEQENMAWKKGKGISLRRLLVVGFSSVSSTGDIQTSNAFHLLISVIYSAPDLETRVIALYDDASFCRRRTQCGETGACNSYRYSGSTWTAMVVPYS